MVRWNDEDASRDLFSLSFGQYAQDALNLKDDFENAFVKGLRSHVIEVDPRRPIPAEIGGKFTPLLLTRIDLRNYNQPHYKDRGVFVGDSSKFDDLLWFWNIRCSGIPLEFLPEDNIDRFRPYVEATIYKFAKSSAESSTRDPFFAFYHRGLPEERVKEISESFPGDILWVNSDLSRTPLSRILAELPSDSLSYDTALGTVDTGESSPTLTLSLPEKKFLPGGTDRRIGTQAIAVSVSEYGNYNYRGHTLKPPHLPVLNEFYSREICIDPWKVRSEQGGIGVLINLDDTYETLRPIGHTDIVRQVLKLAGIESEVSQAGRLTQKIIDRVGSLDSCRVFKVRGVRKLFRSMTTRSAVTKSRATQEIFQAGAFKRHEGLHIQQRETKNLTTDEVFDYLLRHEFFRAGLELLCESCKLSSWLGLREVDDHWTCEYCGQSNLTSVQLKHRGDWKFRRSGLFGRDNNQEGAIPVLLTLMFFNSLFDMGEAVCVPSLNLKIGTEKLETDFVLMRYKERFGGPGIEIAIGECKDEGGAIDLRDVSKLKKARESLEALGLRCYLVFSKAADVFTDEEVDMFRGLYDQDIPIVLFTNDELEPLNPFWEPGYVDDLPQNHPMTCSELVTNSIARYLKN